jgi:protein-tyrosine kinase
MSRIHEALKRAEQERALRETPEAPAQPIGPDAALPQMTGPMNSPKAPKDVEPFESPFPIKAYGSGHPAIDAMVERCQQPDWNPNENTMLFSREGNHQYKAEVFRTLRSRLYRLRDQLPLHTLLITSTLPTEGKSFIAANLSQAIAQQHGRRALLIDADLRAPRLHVMLGAPHNPGLAEYLRGEADEISIIQRGPRNGFFFLPCGGTVTDPVELIGNGRMQKLLERLKDVFDWIVVDSPPMSPVSDASLLADMCDGTLLVVKAAVTPFDLAQKACADLKNKPLVGVVLNGIDRSASYGSYYYSGYTSETANPKG